MFYIYFENGKINGAGECERLDTANMEWIIIEDIKGRLCFISKTVNLEFSITKRNRNKWYKIYKKWKVNYQIKRLGTFCETIFLRG